MKLVGSLDNIDEEVLDKLAELYKDEDGFYVTDERKTLSFGKPRGYFLLRRKFRYDSGLSDKEYCFIWIGRNLWQFSYINVHYKDGGLWEDPLILLNKLLLK